MKQKYWQLTKLALNTTFWSILCLWMGFHTGHKLGFHKGVMLTTELVLKIVNDKTEDYAKLSNAALED